MSKSHCTPRRAARAPTFPLSKRMFKPHYVTWSEQERIEQHSPQFLRNIVAFLRRPRINKQLLSMRKNQVADQQPSQ
jgi:hypothetical protein